MPFIRGEAAVLVALHESVHGPSVVLTTRSATLRHHRGEVSFPGGRQDPGESLRETALREADEEIGLRADAVTLVGGLKRLGTVTSNASIHPHVGVIASGTTFTPSPAEVDRVFSVPLTELIEPGVFREERWSGPGGVHPRPVWFFELAGETVWGATAAMLLDLLSDAVEPTQRPG